MRLTDLEKKSIIEATLQTSRDCHSVCCEIGLFGSRIDDSKKGGDIDLLIVLNSKLDDELGFKIKLRIALFDKIGEQKIDLLLASKDQDDTEFLKKVRSEMKVLWP